MMVGRSVHLAIAFILLGVSTAWGFDYARYHVTDLDALLDQRLPASGADLHRAEPLKLTVTLAAYAVSCDVGLLKKMMLALGFSRVEVETLPARTCVTARSAKGRPLRLFIQEPVVAFLPKEVPLETPVTLFAIHVFTAPDGPGLLVNEFLAGADRDPTKPTAVELENARQTRGCSCGSADLHPGMDYTGENEGQPVQAADDGVVVKIESDEGAFVDTPSTGHCGRYVVIKHTYPNGRSAYTRYGQLGRIVGADGHPLAVGRRVNKKDQIGELGPKKLFHFEVRPVDPAAMGKSAAQRLGDDLTMEWAWMRAVDPRTFDVDVFGGRATDAK